MIYPPYEFVKKKKRKRERNTSYFEGTEICVFVCLLHVPLSLSVSLSVSRSFFLSPIPLARIRSYGGERVGEKRRDRARERERSGRWSKSEKGKEKERDDGRKNKEKRERKGQINHFPYNPSISRDVPYWSFIQGLNIDSTWGRPPVSPIYYGQYAVERNGKWYLKI